MLLRLINKRCATRASLPIANNVEIISIHGQRRVRVNRTHLSNGKRDKSPLAENRNLRMSFGGCLFQLRYDVKTYRALYYVIIL